MFSTFVSIHKNVTLIAAYRQRGAHANNLYRSLQAQYFARHQLHEVASLLIIYHVQFVKDNNAKIDDRSILDRCVDEAVSLECSVAGS